MAFISFLYFIKTNLYLWFLVIMVISVDLMRFKVSVQRLKKNSL